MIDLKTNPIYQINGVNISMPASMVQNVELINKIVNYKPYLYHGMKYLVEDREIIFDIGSSYGINTILLAKLYQNKSFICFDHNLDALNTGNILAKLNHIANIQFIHTAVGLHDVSIHCNQPAFSSDFFIELDNFCNSKVLPDLIKINVGGVEGSVLFSMKGILENTHPDLVIETHGFEIEINGGNLLCLMKFLEQFNYRFFDLLKQEITTAAQYAKSHKNHTSVLLASTNHEKITSISQNKDFIHDLTNDYFVDGIRYLEIKIANYIDTQNFASVKQMLLTMPLDVKNAVAQYYLGYSLHVTDDKYDDAIIRYTKALEYGYEPFWVYYHRGLLYLKIGKRQKGFDDLQKAYAINPSHEGVCSVLDHINSHNL